MKKKYGVKLTLMNFDSGEKLNKVKYKFKTEEESRDFFDSAIWRIDNLT